MITLAIANQKGGTAKTTTAVSLAAALSRVEKRVLLIDLDPQASLSEYYFKPSELADSNQTVYDALIENRQVQPRSIGPGRDLLPATIDLAAADIRLSSRMNQQRILAKFLKPFAARYDYCLVDCSPSLGVLTVNALTAAQYALIPVETELLAERTVKLILGTLDEVKESELNPDLKVWRLLATLYDSRLAHHREILEALRRKYGDLLYQEPMRATTKYKDAAIDRVDVSELDMMQGDYWDRLAITLLAETQGA
jgi:chromosome partitioning protein